MQLIDAEEADLPAFAAAIAASDLGGRYFAGGAGVEATFREFLGNGRLLAAVDGAGNKVGFLCYLDKGAFHSFPYLHIIVVAAGSRSSGVGGAMMDAFEELVFARSDKVFLVVADFNPRAQAFYEKRGYLQVGTIPSLYREGIEERLMMKRRPAILPP